MRTGGIVLIVLGALWAVVGILVVLLGLVGSETVSEMEGIFMLALILFLVPGGILIAIGIAMVRTAASRVLREEQLRYEHQYNRRLSEAKSEDKASGQRDARSQEYGSAYDRRESRFAPPDSGAEQASGGSVYDAGSASRRTSSAPMAEGICRSCGARKRLPAGTSAECDYCGSPITAN